MEGYRYSIVIKEIGQDEEVYFRCDDYDTAKKAFEQARKFGNREMVRLDTRNGKTRLLYDTRPNNNPISSAVGGFINSIPGGQI